MWSGLYFQGRIFIIELILPKKGGSPFLNIAFFFAFFNSLLFLTILFEKTVTRHPGMQMSRYLEESQTFWKTSLKNWTSAFFKSKYWFNFWKLARNNSEHGNYVLSSHRVYGQRLLYQWNCWGHNLPMNLQKEYHEGVYQSRCILKTLSTLFLAGFLKFNGEIYPFSYLHNFLLSFIIWFIVYRFPHSQKMAFIYSPKSLIEIEKGFNKKFSFSASSHQLPNPQVIFTEERWEVRISI